MFFSHPFMLAASFSYLSLVLGLYFRKIRKLHVGFMVLGITVDLAIVLTLEIMRHAVETALAFKLSLFQQLHIATSSVATFLYFPVIILGFKIYMGRNGLKLRMWHLRLGIAAFFFRTLGFILMFSLLFRK